MLICFIKLMMRYGIVQDKNIKKEIINLPIENEVKILVRLKIFNPKWHFLVNFENPNKLII